MPLHGKGVGLPFILLLLRQPIRGFSIMPACQSSQKPGTKELQRQKAPCPQIKKKRGGKRGGRGEKSMFSAGKTAPSRLEKLPGWQRDGNKPETAQTAILWGGLCCHHGPSKLNLLCELR